MTLSGPLPRLREQERKIPSSALQGLWHYDAGYPYDADIYTYDDWSTTDPYYLQDGVRLIGNVFHVQCLDQALPNFLRFLHARPLDPQGAPFPCLREGTIRHLNLHLGDPEWFRLGDIAGLDLNVLLEAWDRIQARQAAEPDVGIWDGDANLPVQGEIAWPTVAGKLRMVVEFLSDSTALKDLHVNPVLYWLLGVQEYWICDPATQGICHVWRFTADGQWADVLADLPPEAGLEVYSEVLQTGVRFDADYGLQCQDPDTGQWIAGDWQTNRREGQQEGEQKRHVTLVMNTIHRVVVPRIPPHRQQALQALLMQTPLESLPDPIDLWTHMTALPVAARTAQAVREFLVQAQRGPPEA